MLKEVSHQSIEQKIAGDSFEVVANSFAKLDNNTNYLNLMQIDPFEVQSDLSASMESPDVWRFTCMSFMGSLVVLPVYSTSDTPEGAMEDLITYANYILAGKCMDIGIDISEQSESREADASIAKDVFDKMILDSIVAITQIVRPKSDFIIEMDDGSHLSALQVDNGGLARVI